MDFGDDIDVTSTPQPLTTTTAAPDMDLVVEYEMNANGEVLVEFDVPDQDFSRVSFRVSFLNLSDAANLISSLDFYKSCTCEIREKRF